MREDSFRVPSRLGAAQADLGGWLAVGLANVIVVAIKLPMPKGGAGTRLLQSFFDFGQPLAAGLLSMAVVAAVLRWGPRGTTGRLGLVAAAAAIAGALVLPKDFAGVAGTRGALPYVVAIGASLVIPATVVVGGLVAKRVRFLPAAVGIALAVTNGFIFERSYLGLHLFMSWMGALLVASSLLGLPVPERARLPRRFAIAGQAVLSLAGAAAIVLEVPSAVLVEMYKAPSSSFAPFLARLHRGGGTARVEGEWYADRRALADVPPSSPRLIEGDTVVVLLTVDCFREDLLGDEDNRATLPNLFALRDEGVFFPQARAPSPSTVTSLAALFMGRFFSQIYWTEQTGAGRQKLFPHNDDGPRVPALLSQAGVRSALVMSGTGFAARYGTTAGFDEYIDRGSPVGIPAAKITDHVISRLEKQSREHSSLFVYSHYFEPHAPYDRAGKEGSPFDRYLREVALVDTEIGRLRAEIDRLGMRDRTVVIVTGDHGEAFGEHNTHDHAVSLYDELIRVPLVVWGASIKPRVVPDLVSVADLGPTILDLNGVSTPGVFMGQSLVPFLRGETPALTRPVVAESGRHVQAMYFPDGYKLIVDKRMGTNELYYLADDPAELRELSSERPEIFSDKLAKLRAYFEAHSYRREGYETPYRP